MTVEYRYDKSDDPPNNSSHWKELGAHRETDVMLRTLESVKCQFRHDVSHNDPRFMALWSCLLGYCEALTTHKTHRYSLYPIPYSALERLVASEFRLPTTPGMVHRQAAQTISNWVWSKVKSKSNVKDELHANSLYIVLRGLVDGKSVDCFGAALVTVIGLRLQGFSSSVLTLSEDHAYESHTESPTGSDGGVSSSGIFHTCEVAIPGNTQAQQKKRGQEISHTFREGSALTPETSWLYMGRSPVRCDSNSSILAAAIANMNPMIETKVSLEVNSLELMELKRELLWILYDMNSLARFPFALCELGWSEEHITSPRGEKMVELPGVSLPVTKMEALYHEAIQCCQTHFQDLQVYPYCYLGYFHKDFRPDEEYRACLAVQYYAEAARVASTYKYEWGDSCRCHTCYVVFITLKLASSVQLTKVMSKISLYIVQEILLVEDKPRIWFDKDAEVSMAQQLARFFDHLLAWEENAQEKFLPILQKGSKTGISKAFALLSVDTRLVAYTPEFCSTLRSERMKRIPLSDPKKLVISDESHLALILADDTRKRPSRKRKPF